MSLSVGQAPSVLRLWQVRTLLGYAGFVEPEGVSIPESRLGVRNVHLRDAIVREQVEANIAHAVEAAGTVQALLLAAAVVN